MRCGTLIDDRAAIAQEPAVGRHGSLVGQKTVERINAPQRPLLVGLLTRPAVMALGIGAVLLGLAAVWALNPLALALSLSVWLLGFVYTWKLKATGVWGNRMVSTTVASTFLLVGCPPKRCS